VYGDDDDDDDDDGEISSASVASSSFLSSVSRVLYSSAQHKAKPNYGLSTLSKREEAVTQMSAWGGDVRIKVVLKHMSKKNFLFLLNSYPLNLFLLVLVSQK